MRPLELVKNMLDGDDVHALEAELESIRSEGSQAYAAIAELEAQKVDCASYDDVEKINRKLGRQQWIVARCDKRTPDVEKRLKAARDRAREQLRRQLMARFEPAVRLYLRKATEAKAAFDEIVAIKSELTNNGFDAVSLTLPGHISGNPVLSREILQLAAAELERRASPVLHATPPSPVARKPAPKATPSATGSQRPIRLGERPEPTPPRARNADDLSALEPGQVRAKVLRAGFSPSDTSSQCDRGQIIRMPRGRAMRAAEHGAVEIVEQPANGVMS